MLKVSLWEQGLYYPNKNPENHVPFNAISLFTGHLNIKIIIWGKWKTQHNKDNESCYMIIK